MYLSDSYEFHCPVKINSGKRALEHLPFELDVLNSRKPLFITNKKAAEKGIVDEVIKALKGSGITLGIFDGVEAETDSFLIRDLFHTYRDKGYDALVAVGGGRIMDAAKALNIAVSGKPEDLEGFAGNNLIKKPLKPLIYLPTLSGDGLEASKHASFSGRVYVSSFLMPNLVIIDSRIIINEDTKNTAATALAALSQSVEAFISKDKNCLVDSYAYVSIRLIMKNLIKALINPRAKDNLVALANAHCMAACAFSNAEAGLAYSLGKIIGDKCGVHRGLSAGILLPHVIKCHNKQKEKLIADLLLALAGNEIFAEASADKRAYKSIDLIIKLQDELFSISGGSIPRTLQDINISGDAIKDLFKLDPRFGFGEFDAREVCNIIESAWDRGA